MSNLNLQPISQKEAFAFIDAHHRHHCSPQGYKFAIGLNDGENVVGVVTVGRPVSRHYDDGYTAEVTRLCVLEGVRNGCSKLYAAAWRAARAMGYLRIITYTLASEDGASLRASNFVALHKTKSEGWSRRSRPRVDTHPTGQKQCWLLGDAMEGEQE